MIYIVVINFNAAETTSAFIKSININNPGDVCVIIVDNGSNIRELKLLNKLRSKNIEIKVLEKQ